MPPVRRGMILNLFGREERIRQHYSLPATLTMTTHECKNLIEVLYEMGKNLSKTLSSKLIEFMFPIAQPNNFIRNRSLYDGNEIFISDQKTQNKNAKKEEKVITEELPAKRPQVDTCGGTITKRRKCEQRSIEVQTDLPYESISDVAKKKYLKVQRGEEKDEGGFSRSLAKLRKKGVDSGEELDTKGTDEDGGENKKIARDRLVIKKIKRSNFISIYKGPQLAVIPEVKNRHKSIEVKQDKPMDPSTLFLKPMQKLSEDEKNRLIPESLANNSSIINPSVKSNQLFPFANFTQKISENNNPNNSPIEVQKSKAEENKGSSTQKISSPTVFEPSVIQDFGKNSKETIAFQDKNSENPTSKAHPEFNDAKLPNTFLFSPPQLPEIKPVEIKLTPVPSSINDNELPKSISIEQPNLLESAKIVSFSSTINNPILNPLPNLPPDSDKVNIPKIIDKPPVTNIPSISIPKIENQSNFDPSPTINTKPAHEPPPEISNNPFLNKTAAQIVNIPYKFGEQGIPAIPPAPITPKFSALNAFTDAPSRFPTVSVNSGFGQPFADIDMKTSTQSPLFPSSPVPLPHTFGSSPQNMKTPSLFGSPSEFQSNYSDKSQEYNFSTMNALNNTMGLPSNPHVFNQSPQGFTQNPQGFTHNTPGFTHNPQGFTQNPQGLPENFQQFTNKPAQGFTSGLFPSAVSSAKVSPGVHAALPNNQSNPSSNGFSLGVVASKRQRK